MTMTSPSTRPVPGRNFNAQQRRGDFPIFTRTIHGKPLVFLDSGASAQKPRQVLAAMSHVYECDYANVHRGVYLLSQRSTELYEAARVKVARFINAPSPDNVVFTRNATEAINLVAASYGRRFLEAGDEIVISELEHHANIVPWQMLAEEKGLVPRVAPIDNEGNFLLDRFQDLLGPRTRLVAVAHVSNVLGTIMPVAEIIRLAHARGIPVLLDGSQAVVHMPVDMQALDADFYVFTGHKLYGPTGIGVLYGKTELLAKMPPYQGGGDMIRTVSFAKSTYQDPPHRFEAGTPAFVEAIGLGAAIDYVQDAGLANIQSHEDELLTYAMRRLGAIDGLRIVGTPREKASIVSFVMADAHAHDVGTILDHAGIAVRAGHHCAQPLMERLGIAATVRASFGLYNTRADIDALVDGLGEVKKVFG